MTTVLRRCRVLMFGKEAGILRETEAGYVFAYEDAYLDDANAHALSVRLPLRSEPFVCATLHPFFDGLIPERGEQVAGSRIRSALDPSRHSRKHRPGGTCAAPQRQEEPAWDIGGHDAVRSQGYSPFHRPDIFFAAVLHVDLFAPDGYLKKRDIRTHRSQRLRNGSSTRRRTREAVSVL